MDDIISGSDHPILNSILQCGIKHYLVIDISLAKIDGDASILEVLKKISKRIPLNHDDAVSVAFDAVIKVTELGKIASVNKYQ